MILGIFTTESAASTETEECEGVRIQRLGEALPFRLCGLGALCGEKSGNHWPAKPFGAPEALYRKFALAKSQLTTLQNASTYAARALPRYWVRMVDVAQLEHGWAHPGCWRVCQDDGESRPN